KPFSGQRGNPESCPLGPRRVPEARCPLWPDEVHEALPVRWEEGIQVDERTEPLGGFVHHSGDHHPPITVPTEDDVREFLPLEHPDDVLDMGVEVDPFMEQMRPFP